MWKKFVVLNLAIVILVFAASAVCLFPVPDKGTQTYDKQWLETYLTDKKVRMIPEEANLLENKEYFLSFAQEGWIGVHHKPEVYIVTPDSNPVLQKKDTYMQSVKIVEVLSGDCETGRQISVDIPGGLCVLNDEAVYIGNYHKNYMRQNNYYLLFCEPLEYQQHRDDYREYRAIPGLMNVLCVNADDGPIIGGQSDSDTWIHYTRRELFTASNEMIRQFNALKHELFERWNVDREKYKKSGGAV